MTSIFKNKPEIKDKNIVYRVAVAVLALMSAVLILTPVVVCVLNGFSGTDSAADNIYYVLRGIFGVALIVSTAVYIVNKDISASAVPCAVGFFMVLFPLYDSVAAYTNAKAIADQFSMTVDYSSYLISIAEYLLFTLLCLFTFLFSIGLFRQTVIIMVISVIASLATIFTSIDRIATYKIPVYEVLCFAYAAIASLIPLFLTLSAKSEQSTKKYKAKRMK